MESDDVAKIVEYQKTADFMTAEELVALRKPSTDLVPANIGPKLSSPSETPLDTKALESALDAYKDFLAQARGARICDLVQAVWNEELQCCITSKLKGKFVHHMGRAVNGEINLSPEESLFLLENGCIEVLNKDIPMSKEEAFTAMLKRKLGVEKYQVYSHLSQLGFIVLPHQKELKIGSQKTSALAKKRKQNSVQPDKPSKRLTFSGAFSDECDTTKPTLSDISLNVKDSNISKPSPQNTDTCDLSASIPEEVKADSPVPSVTDALPTETQSLNTDALSTQTHSPSIEALPATGCSSNTDAVQTPGDSFFGDQSDIKESCEAGTTLKLGETQSPEISTSEKDVGNSKDSSDAKSTFEINEKFSNNLTNGDSVENADKSSNNTIEEIDVNSQEVVLNIQEMDIDSHEVNVESHEVDIESQEVNVESHEVDVESQVDVDSHEVDVDSREVDVDSREVDVDSHEVDVCEVDVDVCEVDVDSREVDLDSREVDISSEKMDEISQEINLDCQEIDVVGEPAEESLSSEARMEINDQSQDSPIEVIDSIDKVNEDSSDLQSCSTDSQEFQSDAEDTESENLYISNKMIDDEITLIEVTKKETTPLAVIDLLSDDEKGEDEPKGVSVSEDEIEIVEVCDKASVDKKPPPFSAVNFSKLNSKKLQKFKSEQSNQQDVIAATPIIQFPNCFNKDLVCVPRPPLHLLPLHVQPNKEAYILDMSKKHNQQSSERSSRPPARLWNSFRDMQDYQRSRRLRSSNHSDSRHGMNNKPWHYQNFGNNFSRNQFRPYNLNNSSESHPFRRNRNNDRNYDLSRNDHHVNISFSNGIPNQDQKPNLNSHSPLMGHFPRPRNFQGNSTNPFSFPRIPNPFSNSVNGGHIPPATFNFATPDPLNYIPPSMAHVPNFAAEVQRTARNMLASMFGTTDLPLPNLLNQPPFESVSSPVPNLQTNQWNGNNSNYNQTGPGNFFNRNHPEGGAFPGGFRFLNNKRSWTDVSAAVEPNKKISEDSSDIEEIPININEYLWTSNVCPLINPGFKHSVPYILKTQQLVQMARMNVSVKEKFNPDTPTLEISFDVYLPGTNFKKSCPGIPKYRIIVTRYSDPLPKFSEIAFLGRKLNDGASLQIAIVDNGDIDFCAFNSVCLPEE